MDNRKAAVGIVFAAGCVGLAATAAALLKHLKEREKWPPLVRFTRQQVAQFWLDGLNWKAVFLASKEAEAQGHRIFRIRSPKIFQKPTVYCTDPAFLRVILGPAGLDKSDESYDALKDAVGLGYNNMITRKWHERYMDIRKGVVPFFSLSNMSKRLSCCSSKLKEFLHVFEQAALEMQPIEVTHWCSLLTLDCLGTAAFGYDFQALSGKGSIGLQVMGTVPFLMEEVANKQRFIPFRKHMTFLKDVRRSKEILKENEALCKSILRDREQQLKSNDSRADGDLLVDLFLKAPYESEEHRAADVMLFLVGGHETAGHQMAWFLYCMVTNPDCLKKAQEEVDFVMNLENGKTPTDPAQDAQGKIPSMSQLKQMPYLNACIQETIRMFPATPEGSGRITAEKMNLGSYIIPAGSQVIVPNYTMLHGCEWGDPECFRPARFMEGKRRKEAVAFGYGPRICPGMNFALLELQVSMAMILRNFDLTATKLPPAGLEMLYWVTSKPRGGLWLLPKLRQVP